MGAQYFGISSRCAFHLLLRCLQNLLEKLQAYCIAAGAVRVAASNSFTSSAATWKMSGASSTRCRPESPSRSLSLASRSKVSREAARAVGSAADTLNRLPPTHHYVVAPAPT